MFTAYITHSRDGYRLHVVDAPLWAIVAEAVAEDLCARLGHPLCQGRWPVSFRLGQRLLSTAARRQRQRWSTPLDDATVGLTFPESVIDFD